MRTKVLIVGGGVVGTSIALFAGRNRDPISEPVALVDRGDLAGGSSGRVSGVVHLQHDEALIASMARDSLRFYETFRARTGRSAGFRRSGVLTFASGERAARLASNASHLQSMGIGIQVLDAAGMRELVNGIQVPDGAVGVYEPQSGYVAPPESIASLAALARSNGTATRLGVEVKRLVIEGGRVHGAETSEGDYEAEQVVLAAGPWVAKLAQASGVELPLRSVRLDHHYLALPTSSQGDFADTDDAETFDEPWTLEDSGLRQLLDPATGEPLVSASELRRPRIPHPVIYDLDQNISIRPDPEHSRIRIGRRNHGTADAVEDPDDLGETVNSAASLREAALRVLPQHSALADLGSQANWCALSLDGRGLAGPVPEVEGLFVASGFANNDFELAPSIGEGISQMLLGEPVSAFNADDFSLERFVPGV